MSVLLIIDNYLCSELFFFGNSIITEVIEQNSTQSFIKYKQGSQFGVRQ